MKQKSTQIYITIKCEEEGPLFNCLSLILIDFVFKMGENLDCF